MRGGRGGLRRRRTSQRLDEEVEPKPILERLAAHPPLDRTPSQETEERYPEIIGGLGVALAETFGVMYRNVKNPQTSHWEGVTAVFDRLLQQSRPGACRRTEPACLTAGGRWRPYNQRLVKEATP
ncbi:DUF1931 family protein [Streptomyces collinus]|uniref:DUF1931 family protein n=1 Tax=Streptomyces collinus TaxID=42684 RepID=UPI0036ED851D